MRRLGALALPVLVFLAMVLHVPARVVSGESANLLDAETQGIEAGTGRWRGWYSATVARSTTQASTGTASLRVDITSPHGWGIELDNYPGFAATAGEKRIRFSALKGAGGALGVTLRVTWRDASHNDIGTDVVTLPSLRDTWQEAVADAVAPVGTAAVWAEMSHASGVAGNYLFVDEVWVEARPVATTSGAGRSSATTTNTPQAVVAPMTPPAQVCGSLALDGPATQPNGSVRVDPGQSLSAATAANPPGTTFWLSRGTHTLGTGQFDQVIPKDGNSYVGAPGAVLDGQRRNQYAFTQRATKVTIRNLTIQGFIAPADEGVVNQTAGDGWTVAYNTVKDNSGAGVFLGSDNVVRSNCLTSNGQYGFNMYRPPVPGDSSIKNVTIDGNEISYNNTDDWEARRPGCGCAGGGKLWDAKDAKITNNWVHNNKGVGVWADTNNVSFLFEGNYINENDAEGITYETSYNVLIRNNTLKRNAIVKGRSFAARNDPFPVGAIYISESGGDTRVSSVSATSEITENVLEDNWSGVILWESSNRFCNSPANTSTRYCTKGGIATLAMCVPGPIDVEPYYSDCRWKTQNVSVRNNDFRFDRAAVGCGEARSCGKQALFADYGTYPDWSPYKGRVIQEAITFNRNNHFVANRYVGDWGFTVSDGSVSFDDWRGSPYNQDAGSTKAA